jgi:3'(2'), 5'-bisphosphate nucleotidase
MIDLNQFYKIVLAAMEEASDAIVDIYNHEIKTQIKEDGSPVTQADIASSKIISKHLSKLDFPILGEEIIKASFEERQHWEYYWCVDPLDGTKEFIKKNGEFAINIALIHQNRAVFGAICSPITKEVILGGEGFGVFSSMLDGTYKLNTIPKVMSRNDEITLMISRSHMTDFAKDFITELEHKYGKLNYLGKGSALKFFDLANGTADLYARFGPTMEWDIAAGHAILTQLGGEIYQYEKSEPLMYNKVDLLNPPFIAYTYPLLKEMNYAEN